MRKTANLIGKRFDRLIVLERAENNKHGQIMWKCQCDCGIIKNIYSNSLTTHRIKSCGCYSVQFRIKHGKSCHDPTPKGGACKARYNQRLCLMISTSKTISRSLSYDRRVIVPRGALPASSSRPVAKLVRTQLCWDYVHES